MDNIISFTKVALPYGWLGNMAPYPVKYMGKRWRTTEALFQGMRFDGYPEIQEQIREQKSPMAAKMIAKKHKHLLENDPAEDLERMKLCLLLKIEQHSDLRRKLLATKDAMIIEDCTKRPRGSGKFWGAVKKEDGTWEGDNVLGKLWMEIREEEKMG